MLGNGDKLSDRAYGNKMSDLDSGKYRKLLVQLLKYFCRAALACVRLFTGRMPVPQKKN
ncbi:MAG: hypothetical protein F6K41_11500 [Symploca sp. SIO3E6]|nr:hypothetical protein [Caldora sp. SIO3E6]